MRRIMVILMVSAVVLAAFHLAGAEEELFDTKAAAAHIEKGITHLKNKNYDAAINELEEAADINPDAEAYYYLGYAYYMKGKKGDAESRKKSIEAFDKAYELNPGFTPSRFKPAETPELPRKAKPKETPETPAVPSGPAEPVPQSEEQTSGVDQPSQPTPPAKTTDKLMDIRVGQ